MKTFIVSCALVVFNLLFAPHASEAQRADEYDTIVNGYTLYSDFHFVLEPEHYCYGVPAGPFRHYRCSLCQQWYVTQLFRNKEGEYIELFSDSYCNSDRSSNGYHEGFDLEPIGECLCVTVLFTDN
jgi:hypothetical protein